MDKKEVESIVNKILMERESKAEDGVYIHSYLPTLPIGTVFRFVDDNDKFVVCECEKDVWPCDVCELNACAHKTPKVVLAREFQCKSFCCSKRYRRDVKNVFVKKVEE